jgi:hypothetical protein
MIVKGGIEVKITSAPGMGLVADVSRLYGYT